jgi:mono/diheme cytochrome c family protein
MSSPAWLSALGTKAVRVLAGCAFCMMGADIHAQNPGPAATGSVERPTISWTWSTIAPQPASPRGYVQFERDCGVCHESGPAKPGTRALQTKYQGKEPALLAERADLAPDYIRIVVRRGLTVMPPFRKTELSDADLEDIVAYLTRKHHQ